MGPARDVSLTAAPVDELLARANRADMPAVGELLERFEGYIEAQIRRQRTDVGQPPGPNLVQELVQEVRMRVLGRVAAQKSLTGGESGFRAFLRETAWHLWLDHVAKRAGPETPFPTTGESMEDGGDGRPNLLAIQPAPDGDPLRQLEALEARQELDDTLETTVWELIDAMDARSSSKPYRDLYALQLEAWRAEEARLPKINQTEMARRLGCSQAAVSTRLKHIWDHLKKHWPKESGLLLGIEHR